MEEHGIKWGSINFQDIDYADDLNILDEKVSKLNELLEILRVHGARIGLKINVKNTKSLRLRISEKKGLWVSKRSIKWTALLTLVVLLVKMVCALMMLKVEQPRLRVLFQS
jgi:hypothetical protein